MDETTKFRKLLDGYRDTYLQFVSTGSQQYKDASQTILGQIQATIDSRRQQHADETKTLGSFLQSYTTQQAHLDSLESTSAQKLDEIQSIQNEYAATQERYDMLTTGTPPPSTMNDQRGYEIALRLGLLLLFVVVFFLVGYFFPSETLGMFAQQQQAVASAAAAASAAVAAVTPRPGAFGMASPASPFFRSY